ncbi:L,D-transpeptidase family protein [Streptomyces jumonjinensis]|nr:L,D-transpeptidase family protein [Streptomyces jumonjinensis]
MTGIIHPTRWALPSAAVSLTLLAGIAATASAAATGPTPPTTHTRAHGPSTAAATHSASRAVHLKFDKSSPSSSTLSVLQGGTVKATFRAGSGSITNECTTGKGWLPNGTYTLGQHTRTYDGTKIKGYAIRLPDKKCHNGTGRARTALFIHSEMNRNGSQGSTEQRRWTDTNPNDFYSEGCIKLRPADIRSLFNRLDRIGWPTTLTVVS